MVDNMGDESMADGDGVAAMDAEATGDGEEEDIL